MRSLPPPSEFEEESVVSLQERARAASRSTWVSVLVNVALSAVQILIGYFAKSQALIADGIHTLSDLLSDAIVLLANRASHKAPDAEHPYGHQRYETAASFAIGTLVLGVGAAMLWAAVQKVQNPDGIAIVHPVALYAALAALIGKELLFRYLLTVAKRVKSSLLVANAWHARSDAASSLVVVLGILGNLAGYPILDPIAALVVGLMVLRMGWHFAWNAMNDLMDRAIDEEEAAAIRATIAATPGVRAVHDLRTRKMGDMILADAHIEVDADLTVEAGHDIAVEAQRRVMQRHRVLNLMTHVDPWRRPDRDHEASAL